MAHIRGTAQLRHVRRLLKDAPADLRKELREGIRRPVHGFRDAVRGEVPAAVPARYAGVLAPAIRVDLTGALRGAGLGYTLIVYAKGKAEDRDVVAVNAGVLRHKTWGHEPWHAQRVRAGFVDRPADKLGAAVAREADAAVERVAQKIEHG